MTKEVEIEALKPFNRTPQGGLCEVGERFPVGEVRAAELERLGLAKPVKPARKASPEPANKMAPAAANKRARTSPRANPRHSGVQAAEAREALAIVSVARELP
jgi:hypothetical protein